MLRRWLRGEQEVSSTNVVTARKRTLAASPPPQLESVNEVEEPRQSRSAHSIGMSDNMGYVETMIHLLKGNIGAGLFSMADAFRNCGIILAPFLTLFLGVVCVHSQHLLVHAAEELRKRMGIVDLPSYAETVELAFETGPMKFVKFSRCMTIMVNVFLCITQLGFCAVYFVFVAHNTKQIFDYYGLVWDVNLHLAAILLPIMLSCWIRNLKYLVPVSFVANVFMAFGIVGTLYVISKDLPPPPYPEVVYIASYDRIPLFLGTVIFAFEGISLVLPLKGGMKKQDLFNMPFGVLNMGMTVVTTLLIVTGTLGYIKYGDKAVLGSLTLNLPEDEIISQVIKGTISVGIMFTYAIQMYVPVTIIWPGILDKWGPFKHPAILEIVLRTFLVLFTFVIALVVPCLSTIISLIGAVSSTFLALFFPAILDIIVRFDDIGVGRLLKNFGIIAVGMCGFLFGTYASIVELITCLTPK